jgi:RNA polymerase sigma-70 factor (ECF subfamily)
MSMIAPPYDSPTGNREALVISAIAGERASLEALVHDIWPAAYKIAWSVLRNSVAAEDAAQDACAQVATHIAALRSPQAFTIWFYRIVVRAALRYRAQPLDVLTDTVAGAAESIEDRLDLEQQILRLDRSLRVVVVLRYYLDCTSREIATILGIPAPTVRFRLTIARNRLRTALTTPIAGGTS